MCGLSLPPGGLSASLHPQETAGGAPGGGIAGVKTCEGSVGHIRPARKSGFSSIDGCRVRLPSGQRNLRAPALFSVFRGACLIAVSPQTRETQPLSSSGSPLIFPSEVNPSFSFVKLSIHHNKTRVLLLSWVRVMTHFSWVT